MLCPSLLPTQTPSIPPLLIIPLLPSRQVHAGPGRWPLQPYGITSVHFSGSGVSAGLEPMTSLQPYGIASVHFSFFARSHSATNDHQFRSFLPLYVRP